MKEEESTSVPYLDKPCNSTISSAISSADETALQEEESTKDEPCNSTLPSVGTLDTVLLVPTLETAESVVNTMVDRLW